MPGDAPDGYLLSPEEVLDAPKQDEIASRWPGMPTDEALALADDYDVERYEVQGLKLEDVVEKVRELVEEDGRWEV